jgi:hypothetical protein
MRNVFLKTKDWQLFSTLIGLPLLGFFLTFVLFFTYSTSTNDLNSTTLKNFTLIFPSIVLLSMVILFGWFWSIAIGLQSRVVLTVKMNVKKFKILFFIAITYLFVLLAFSIFMGTTQFELVPQFLSTLPLVLMFIVFPIHLIAIFCIFHTIYFVAKTYKTVELQREVSFSDFTGEFFLVWFYFIGIWIIQPKINNIAKGIPVKV